MPKHISRAAAPGLKAPKHTRPAVAHGSNDLSEWYAAQYKASVGVSSLEGGAKFKGLISSFPSRAEQAPDYPMTGRQRMSSFLSLKLCYPLGPDGYSCMAMVAAIGGASAHYGYAYWRRGQESEDPEYVCISPTFDSRDGEYRRRFIRGPVFIAACEKLVTELAPFEEAVLAMAGNVLELKTAAYPEEMAENLSTKASNARLPVLAFTVSLALDLWEIKNRMLMTHTSTAYTAIMAEVARLQPSLVSSLAPPLSPEKVKEMQS